MDLESVLHPCLSRLLSWDGRTHTRWHLPRVTFLLDTPLLACTRVTPIPLRSRFSTCLTPRCTQPSSLPPPARAGSCTSTALITVFPRRFRTHLQPQPLLGDSKSVSSLDVPKTPPTQCSMCSRPSSMRPAHGPSQLSLIFAQVVHLLPTNTCN